MVVFANRIEGAFAQGAIHLTSVQALSTGGTNTINMRALGNVAICPGASGAPGVGIYFAAGFAATYIVNMINNTVVGCSDTGLFVDSIVTGANVQWGRAQQSGGLQRLVSRDTQAIMSTISA